MSSRPKLRTLFLVPLSLLTLQAEVPEKPNIVLIVADDLGWKDTGRNGTDYYETPRLDELARTGMQFTSGYAAGANCAPSRACMVSGKYTPRHGVYAVGSTDRGPHISQRLIPIPNRDGLGNTFLTMAEALKDAGYATGHFGKWHLGGKDGSLPTQQGFDVSFDSFGDGQREEGSEANLPGPPHDPKGVFVLTQKAAAFIEAHKDTPFFCYLAHHAPHFPLQARPESLEKFRAKPPGALQKDPMYAACTYDLDASVGHLMDTLRDLGLDKKTLVIFTSDNGAARESPQEPLRGQKGAYYEAGIRVPFLARWEGVIPPGSRSDIPVTNVDLFPTFLAAAGATIPSDLDGESFLPILKGRGGLSREAVFWHFPGYLNGPVNRGRALDVATGFRTRPVTVIRKGDWKLHLFHEEWQLDGGRAGLPENHAVELYHLADDPGERSDLAASHPTKRDELLNDLLAWITSAEAPLPTEPNPKYDPAAQVTAKGPGPARLAE